MMLSDSGMVLDPSCSSFDVLQCVRSICPGRGTLESCHLVLRTLHLTELLGQSDANSAGFDDCLSEEPEGSTLCKWFAELVRAATLEGSI